MAQKKLQKDSRFEAHDLDGDGIVTDEEIAREKEMVELELREEKAKQQQSMAWVAMGSMLVFSTFLFLPIIPDSRVNALADLLGLFYIAQAGVVGGVYGRIGMDEPKIIFRYQGRLNKYREYERWAKIRRKNLQVRLTKRKREKDA